MAHWCQATTHFEMGCCVKNWHLDTNAMGKNSHCIKVWHPICCCQTSSYHSFTYHEWYKGDPRAFDGPLVSGHNTFLRWAVSKIDGTLTPMLGQNSHCIKVWHPICCCQTSSYHPCTFHEWCKGDPRAFDGPLVSGHNTFWSWAVSKIGTLTPMLDQNSHCIKVWHPICCCQTSSYHSSTSHEWCKGDPRAFDGPLVSGHNTFWSWAAVSKIGTLTPMLWGKTHTVSRCDTVSVAARLVHIIHLPPMNGVRVTQEHLMAHWCQAITHF
jgi:hypothetical protein